MRALVCGDRDWTDRDRLFAALDELLPGPNRVARHLVIEGEARGADSMAREWAEARSVAVMRFPAEWDKYGKAAGPIRNRQMLDEGQPELVIYFHDDIGSSRGTANMVQQAKRRGIPVVAGAEKGAAKGALHSPAVGAE